MANPHPDGYPRPVDDVPASGAGVSPAPAPAHPVADRWAFSSRTIQRLFVAAIMFWVSKQDFAAFVDQQLVADVVSLVFGAVGTVYIGFAARARQLGAATRPERIYWLPRLRARAHA